jgi:hypothetical protein
VFEPSWPEELTVVLVVVVDPAVAPIVDGPPQAARPNPATTITDVNAALARTRIGRRRYAQIPALVGPSVKSP